MKKRLSLAVAVTIFLGVVGWLVFGKHCKEPNQLEVKMAATSCIIELLSKGPEQIISNVCVELGRPADCQLAPGEQELGMQAVKQMALRCVKEKLESQNMCTDKALAELSTL